MKKKNFIFGIVFSICAVISGTSGAVFADSFEDIYGTSEGNATIGAGDSEICNSADAANNPACQNDGNAFGTAKNIINAILAIMGVAATVVIIIAGIMMSTSAGDAGKVKKAKNAIIYAAIGLVITVGASLIVNFVLTNVFE